MGWGGVWGALTQDDEGRAGGQHDGPPHGVWSQTDAALKALRLPGHVRLLRAQKWTEEKLNSPEQDG